MAQLPKSDYLIQLIGTDLVIFHRHTEEELVRYDSTDPNATAMSQKAIHELKELGPEDKSIAHFWCGYFYAHAVE